MKDLRGRPQQRKRNASRALIPGRAALGLAHALAEIRDGASRKPAQFRCLSFGLAMFGVSDHKIIQPKAQLGAILDRKLRDRVLDVFEGHQRSLAVRLEPGNTPWLRSFMFMRCSLRNRTTNHALLRL